MTDQAGSSPLKFPYLVLSNKASTGPDNKEDAHAPRRRESQQKRDGTKDRVGTTYQNTNYVTFMDDPYANMLSHSTNRPTYTENPAPPTLANFSMSQMKAILTAQKELRKPAGSLYPTAAQFSLIPETEMIYKKYFPSEGSENLDTMVKVAKASGRSKLSKQNRTRIVPGECQVKLQPKSSVGQSISNPSIPVVEGTNTSSSNSDIALDEAIQRIRSPKDIARQKDNEMAKFKKRMQAQLMSLCGEVERQATEMSELRKEVKEVLQTTRKNATDYASLKSRLDTLSKHVFDIDSKMDNIQDSVVSQEKNFLNKLILFGDATDSDSDSEEQGLRKAASNLSLTKDGSSRPSSGQTSYIHSQGSSSNDFLPKGHSNWVPIAPDFDKLIQSIAVLNYRMDRNQSMKMCTTNNGATFKHSDVIDMTIFKNGISLGSTGFRTFSTMSVIKLVNEIFNGYMPTELSTQFPEGVVIVLTDKRSISHSVDENFNGKGAKLSANAVPELVPGSNGSGNSIVRKQSLESLNASATVSSQSLPSITCSVAEQTGIIIIPDLRLVDRVPYGKAKTINLKIRHLKNGKQYKLTVSTKATVKAVIDHLTKAITSTVQQDESKSTTPPCKSYELILPVPHGKLSSGESTLEEYGLTANTLVYIQEGSS